MPLTIFREYTETILGAGFMIAFIKGSELKDWVYVAVGITTIICLIVKTRYEVTKSKRRKRDKEREIVD